MSQARQCTVRITSRSPRWLLEHLSATEGAVLQINVPMEVLDLRLDSSQACSSLVLELLVQAQVGSGLQLGRLGSSLKALLAPLQL